MSSTIHHWNGIVAFSVGKQASNSWIVDTAYFDCTASCRSRFTSASAAMSFCLDDRESLRRLSRSSSLADARLDERLVCSSRCSANYISYPFILGADSVSAPYLKHNEWRGWAANPFDCVRTMRRRPLHYDKAPMRVLVSTRTGQLFIPTPPE